MAPLTPRIIADRNSRCVAVSSVESGDGKTTICASLALNSARSGRRTLLVDADLRRPGLTRTCELGHYKGLGDLLRVQPKNVEQGASHFNCFVRSGVLGNLDVLPCGERGTSSPHLLNTRRFVDLVAWAQQEYDQVLIDCPPMFAASDAFVVGQVANGLLLVCQPEKNHRRSILRGADEMRARRITSRGIVINHAVPELRSALRRDVSKLCRTNANADERPLTTANDINSPSSQTASLLRV